MSGRGSRRQAIPYEAKVDILRRLEAGEKPASVAEALGVNRSTVYAIRARAKELGKLEQPEDVAEPCAAAEGAPVERVRRHTLDSPFLGAGAVCDEEKPVKVKAQRLDAVQLMKKPFVNAEFDKVVDEMVEGMRAGKSEQGRTDDDPAAVASTTPESDAGERLDVAGVAGIVKGCRLVDFYLVGGVVLMVFLDEGASVLRVVKVQGGRFELVEGEG